MPSVMVVVKTPAAVTCSLQQSVILLRDNCLEEFQEGWRSEILRRGRFCM